MLVLKVVNDATGTLETANYRYDVYVNAQLIASGRLEDHTRADGWTALVSAIARQEQENRSVVNLGLD